MRIGKRSLRLLGISLSSNLHSIYSDLLLLFAVRGFYLLHFIEHKREETIRIHCIHPKLLLGDQKRRRIHMRILRRTRFCGLFLTVLSLTYKRLLIFT